MKIKAIILSLAVGATLLAGCGAKDITVDKEIVLEGEFTKADKVDKTKKSSSRT